MRSKVKVILFFSLVLLSTFTAYSMFSTRIEPLFNLKPIEFGIDLTGGSRLSLEVNEDVAEQNLTNEIVDLLSFYGEFKESSREADAISLNGTFVDRENGIKEFRDTYPNLSIHEHGNGLLISNLQAMAAQNIAEAVKGNIDVINTRLNGLGLADVTVYKQGNNKIIVELPSSVDISEAKKLLTSTSRVNMFLTDINGTKLNYEGFVISRSNTTIASGKDIISATPIIDQQSGQPSIAIRLSSEAGRVMGKITSHNIGNPIVTTITNGFGAKSQEKVLTVATIKGAFSREFSLTGVGSFEDNERLALVLKSGVMKAPMEIISEEEIDTSMGAINVQQGFTALLTAVAALFIYIVAKYRWRGAIACFTLLSTASLLVILMSIYGASFTMMSIIGVVLTMGMAVDINVIVFERLKQTQGNTRESFEQSWASIRDANLTTAFAAQMLFVFGSTQLKGLALVMIFGICASVISSYWFNKNILTALDTESRGQHS